MTPSQRHVSGTYLATQTRPYDLGLDALPNQGHVDTSMPSHVGDIDAIRRAGTVPPPPRVVRHRRMRITWGWQEVATLAAIALIVIVLVALLRQPIVTGR